MSVASIGKSKGRRGGTAKALPKTLKVKVAGIGGIGTVTKNFTKESCSKLKTDGVKKVESLRKQGFTARLKQDPLTKTWCAFKGAKSKK